jgi:hypothetical protein
MSGTLVTNYVQPDLNTDLTLNQRNSTGNTVAIGALYAGQNANTPLAGATNPTIGSIQSANNYIQNYVYNTANGSFSSADFTAYPNNGSDASGWVDMGITSNNYSQATYSITGRNEGYVLMSAPSGSGTSGNLVFATDSTGLYNSFQWYANGFNQSKSTPSMVLDKNSNLNITGSINATNSYNFKNKIINGGFDVWQRATSFTDWGSFAYLVDRARIGYDGSPATGRTLSQQTFALGQTDILEGDPKYYLQYVFPNCGTPNNYIRWDIEGVRTLAGKKATFSFWARVPSGTMSIGVAIAQEFGSGGSPSGGVYPAQTNYTVTTTWQKFVYTTTMASVSGKTLGSNNDDRIWPAIYFPPNAAGTIQIANCQLEEGTAATTFEKRPYAAELAMCQRYYYQTAVSVGPYYNSNAGNVQQGNYVAFKTTMRIAPTITYTNISATLTNTDQSSFITPDGFNYGANLTGNGTYSRYSTAKCDAEL